MQPVHDHGEHQPSLQQLLEQTRKQVPPQLSCFFEVQQMVAAAFVRGSTTLSSRSPSPSIASIIDRSSSLGSGMTVSSSGGSSHQKRNGKSRNGTLRNARGVHGCGQLGSSPPSVAGKGGPFCGFEAGGVASQVGTRARK
jgi:hypothetical protein